MIGDLIFCILVFLFAVGAFAVLFAVEDALDQRLERHIDTALEQAHDDSDAVREAETILIEYGEDR